MPDPTTTQGARQPLAEIARTAIERGDQIYVLDLKAAPDGAIVPADVTDALLAAGADVAEAERLDAEVHQLQAAGDPTVASRFYDTAS